MVKATINTEEGKKTINSLDYPSIRSAESDNGSNRMINFIKNIYSNFVGAQNNN